MHALESQGHIIVPIGDFGSQTKWIVKTFLSQYCKALEIPTIVPHSLKMESLKPNERFVILNIEKYLSDQRCEGLAVQPCKFVATEDVPMMIDEQKEILFINVSHKYFKDVLGHTNTDKFPLFIDAFLRDNLEDALARRRRKIFGPQGKGISLIAPNKRWKILLKGILELVLMQTSSETSIWEGDDTEIIYMKGEAFEQMHGHYLRIPDPLYEAFKEYLTQEHKIEVIAFLKKVFYLIYYEVDEALTLEIDLDKSIPPFLGDDTAPRAFTDVLKTHIRIYPKGAYLPIHDKLVPSFSPKRDLHQGDVHRTLWVGVKTDH